jgi:hypothetical protein
MTELYTRTCRDPDFEISIREWTYNDVTIPEGFRSDGASTPRFLWWIIPPWKRTKKAAFLHDYLCRYATCKEERREADIAFYNALIDTAKISSIRCKLGYLGVRLGALLGIGVRYTHWIDNIKIKGNRK